MSAFTGELTITSMDADCRVWRLESDLAYEVGEIGSGNVILVEAGFSTDGASIPRWAQIGLPAWGRYSRAAIIHDYLCRRWRRRDPHPAGQNRQKCNDIFFEAMRVSEVPFWLAAIIWLAVTVNPGLPQDPIK